MPERKRNVVVILQQSLHTSRGVKGNFTGMLILLLTVLLSTFQVNNELLRTCEAEVTAYVKAKKHGIIWIIDGRVGYTEWVPCRRKRYQDMKLENQGPNYLVHLHKTSCIFNFICF